MRHGFEAFGIGCALLGSMGIVGCTSHNTPATQTSVVPVTAPAGPVIVRLVGRDYSVVISAGPKRPVYTVRNGSGQLLAQNLTLEELHEDHPELYQKIAPAMSPHSSAAVLWASSLQE